MKKTKIIVILLVIIALALVHKNPITEDDIKNIAPVSTEVEASVEKSKDAFDFLKEKAEDIWKAIKENFGYSTDATAENYSEDEYDVTNTEVEAFELVRVVDGDTIVINDAGIEAKVRLIGLDTPESVNSDESKNTVYGDYASDYTKALLQNVETVYLSYDVEATDQFGRILAYVWLDEPEDVDSESEIKSKMVNYNILANGYAADKVYEPNHKYAEIFNIARCDAQKQSIGLWQYEEYVAMVE